MLVAGDTLGVRFPFVELTQQPTQERRIGFDANNRQQTQDGLAAPVGP